MPGLTQNNTARNKFHPLTPDLTIEKFIKYRPDRDKDQDFDSYRNRRGKGPNLHRGIDYGSRAGITLGTKITSVQGGTATLIPNYYSKNGVTDSAVVVTGKDSQGRTVRITYGHLSQSSVNSLFKGRSSVSVNPGDVLGLVGSTGRAGRNEYHVHVKVEVDGVVVNPLEYFQNEAESSKKSENDAEMSGEDAIYLAHNHEEILNDLQVDSNSRLFQHEKSIAIQRYEAISDILKNSGIKENSSEWNNAVVQVAMGTDLQIEDVMSITKQIPGIKTKDAEQLVTGAIPNSQEMSM